VSDRLTILVIVGTRTDARSLRSQMGVGSESVACLGSLTGSGGFQIQRQG